MIREVYILDEVELAEIEEQFETGFWFKLKRLLNEMLKIPYIRLY
jgi:hypothetical protein